MKANTVQEKKIYLVGGAVRDALMGREVTDREHVAAGDLPEERIEAVLGQRDLTVNAIAYDEQEDVYVDPYEGREDIGKRMLRHVSEAFSAEPVNVLRLAYFRAAFGTGWNIHATTRVTVYRMRDALGSLPPERVWREVEKALALPDAHLFFETLFELGVLDVLFPSLFAMATFKEGTKYHREASLLAHVMMVLRELKNESMLLKLTALYHDVAKPFCFRTYGNGMRHGERDIIAPLIDMAFPEQMKERILFLSENHVKLPKLPQMSVYHIADFFESLNKDETLLEELIRFKRADDQGRFTDVPRPEICERALLKTFDAICAYNPRKWIASQPQTPDAKAVALHVHLQNIEIVKRTFFA